MASRTPIDPRPAKHFRVVLGATCYADAEGALSLAVALARQVEAELHGLLVRDEGILTAAGRPRARVVTYSGDQASAISRTEMLRAYEADARRFEERLTGLARTARVAARFNALEGRLSEVVLQSSGQGDVVILGFRRAMRDSGSVVLVLGKGHQPPAFAAPLAAGLGKRLVVLCASDEDRPAALHSEFETRRFHDREELLRQLETLSPAAVIIAADPGTLPATGRVLDAARCPVVVTTD
ncbi:hypothetical protein [Roseovarius salis]|uniref:hypothetical protein n=1 Tax=Roseovarius salis TaxID=3376063 RepID=UPI0037CB6300